MEIQKLSTDNEYSALIFPPTDEEYQALKASIAAHGIYQPLMVNGHGVILDGHTRLKIARELGLTEVPVDVMGIDDRLEAMEYIIMVNVQRRHMNTAQKAEMAKRLLPIEEEMARKRKAQAAGKHRGTKQISHRQMVADQSGHGKSLDVAAEKVGISGETLRMAVQIERHFPDHPELKDRWEQALAGRDSVNAVHKRLGILENDKAAEKATGHAPPVSSDPDTDRILLGDCLEILPTIASHSVDLIVTSPPYADNRKSTYEGHAPDEYVRWFMPIADEMARVLKLDGSFILNIKERAINGERGTYVHDLIREMRARGWRWVEEYVWVKKNTTPGRWPTRFQDRWERCHHFTRSEKFRMYQNEVREPIGTWAKKRLAKLSDADLTRLESATQSGFGRNMSRWVGKKTVNPCNVIVLATESSDKGHSAAFPVRLPAWFIRLFTKDGDTVLDPFVGSGTTAVAAVNLGRHYVGIEKHPPYHRLAKQRVADAIKAFVEHGTPADYMMPVSKVNGDTPV